MSNYKHRKIAKSVEPVYAARDYLEAYREHTERRVAADPQRAIGGMWEQIGKLQFEFLLRQGASSPSILYLISGAERYAADVTLSVT